MEILVTMLRSKVGALICALLAFPAWAIDADGLADLVGYTIVAATQVPGEFEGADFDKVVKLENGMVFEFLDYSYSYSYRPTVVVFARRLSVEDLKKIMPNRQITQPLVLYMLLIDDELYDVTRIR